MKFLKNTIEKKKKTNIKKLINFQNYRYSIMHDDTIQLGKNYTQIF
tara:strand:+ start:319 stop:456 length:138 start_codon:yes stop_codon:yes gene_type:complete